MRISAALTIPQDVARASSNMSSHSKLKSLKFFLIQAGERMEMAERNIKQLSIFMDDLKTEIDRFEQSRAK